MKTIILVCAGGMSTSLLMNRMNEAAQAQGVDVQTTAMSVEAFEKYTGPCDLLLIGPQVSYRKRKLEALVAPKGIEVAIIDNADYGMMDGAAVLTKALGHIDS